MKALITGVICVTFVLWGVTGYLPILKYICMSLFGRFSFSVPARSPEINCPRYGSDGKYDYKRLKGQEVVILKSVFKILL